MEGIIVSNDKSLKFLASGIQHRILQVYMKKVLIGKLETQEFSIIASVGFPHSL